MLNVPAIATYSQGWLPLLRTSVVRSSTAHDSTRFWRAFFMPLIPGSTTHSPNDQVDRNATDHLQLYELKRQQYQQLIAEAAAERFARTVVTEETCQRSPIAR